MTMGNKIVKVYVLKGLNGTSLVIENYRVSNEKIYGMLTPIHTFEVATDDILQAIGLKHNRTEDCVSREQAKIDVIPNSLYTSEQVIALLDNLSSVTPTQKWIPVSEDLPKENGWYQCTVILNDLPRTMELFYKNGKWLDNRRINMFDTYDIYGYGNTKEKHKLSYQELISEFEWNQVVIAWQPLPQPYEEKRGNENDSN